MSELQNLAAFRTVEQQKFHSDQDLLRVHREQKEQTISTSFPDWRRHQPDGKTKYILLYVATDRKDTQNKEKMLTHALQKILEATT